MFGESSVENTDRKQQQLSVKYNATGTENAGNFKKAVLGVLATTAGRKSADTDLDACEVDIDALLSRDQPLFAISESAVLVQCRICSLQSG